MADRFYTPEPLGIGHFTLDGAEAHHLASVRRIPVGNTVILFNGDGHEYAAEILSVGKKRVDLLIQRREWVNRERAIRVHIASSMPKGDRGDFLIEKLTELGATSFTPLQTERSIVKIDAEKIDKLQRAVIEASKQCGRNVLMKVHPMAKFHDWCATISGQRWLAHPTGERLIGAAATAEVTIALGPEGGFSDVEVAHAQANGWESRHLGTTILRIETAALAAVTLASTRNEQPSAE